MANTFGGGFASISTTGFVAATGGASARSTIPVDGSGNRPNYIRVAATASLCVKMGDVTVVATTGDTMVQPGDALFLQVGKANTHIAYIQDTLAGRVNVQALDNS